MDAKGLSELVRLHYQVEVPPRLTLDLRRGRAATFVGSGMSHPAGIPTWKELLERVRRYFELQKPTSFASCRQALATDDPLILATALKHSMGVADFHRVLRAELARYHVPRIPPGLSDLVRLPFRFFITTNFDRLIEFAYFEQHRSLLPCFNLRAMADLQPVFELDRPCVVKLHGDIDAPETLVITKEDYDAIPGAAVVPFLERVARECSVLFVGYSFSDAHVVQSFRSAHSNLESSYHYAVTQRPDHDLGRLKDMNVEPVPQTLADDIARTTESFLAKLRIRQFTDLDVESATTLSGWTQRVGLEPAQLMRSPLRGYEFLALVWKSQPTTIDSAVFEIIGVCESKSEVIFSEDARGAAMYPADVLERGATGLLVEYEFGGNMNFHQLVYISSDGARETLCASYLSVDDIDNDGRPEVLAHRETTSEIHAFAHYFTSVYRLEHGRFVNVTFDSGALFRPGLDDISRFLVGLKTRLADDPNYWPDALNVLSGVVAAAQEVAGKRPRPSSVG